MGYQYRMLAVNRIEGLLAAGIRNIDGAQYLYYDITSRQSVSDLCKDRMLPPELIRKLLYAVGAAGKTLSCYLLDDSRLLLAPEFIYYDFEREEFFFVYYPEPIPGMGYMELFQFLSSHVDPQEKRAAFVVYHLCELAGNQNFILKEDFLDREYGKDRRRKSVLPVECYQEEEEHRRIEQEPYQQTEENPYEPTYIPREEPEEIEQKPETSRSPLVRILIVSVMFLLTAIGLEVLQTYIQLTAREQVLVRAGVMICLGLAILSALYGTFQGYRHSKMELRAEKERIVQEKKYELTNTLEYDLTFVV